jgi:ribosomal protein S18 acetylase RimI-like enzyme
MPPPINAAARFNLVYRPLAKEDFGFIEALYFSTRAEEVAQSGWPEAQQHAFLTQQHGAQHHHYQTYYPKAEWLIVERDDAPIGRLYLDEWPNEFSIIDISLVPAARGQGMGEAMLRDVIALAAARGKGVSIYVEKFNPARRLYARLGFVVVEDEGIYDLMELGTPRAAQSA